MRLRGTLLMVVAITASAGCGPKATPVAPDPGGASPNSEPLDTVATVRTEPTAENMCQRLFELEAAGCGEVGLTEAECRDNAHRSLEERGQAAHDATVAYGHCLVDNESCDAVVACANALSQPVTGFRGCDDDPNAAEFIGKPVGLPRSEYDQRKGAGVRRYSQHASTLEAPIETCQVAGQIEWLYLGECDDGSHPFRSREHAHAARLRNVGAGGRCGAIVDLYSVACPEGTYEIYLDAYVCPIP